MKSPKSEPSPLVAAHVKVWLEADGQYVFGRGISRILAAVQQEGSIKAAAAVVGKSYRHIWTRIKETEEALGIPLVETTVGGNDTRRSELTHEAKLLVRHFDRLRERVRRLVKKESASLLDVLHDAYEGSS